MNTLNSFPSEDGEVKTAPVVVTMSTQDALGAAFSGLEVETTPPSAPSQLDAPAPLTLEVQEAAEQAPVAANAAVQAKSSVAFDLTAKPEITPEEVLELQIPLCLQEPTLQDNRFTLQLYSGDCLDCNELVENGDVKGRDLRCHASKGNLSCPANEIKMIFVGPRNFWLNKCLKARDSGDTERYLDVLQDLRKKEPPLREWVLAQLGLI